MRLLGHRSRRKGLYHSSLRISAPRILANRIRFIIGPHKVGWGYYDEGEYEGGQM